MLEAATLDIVLTEASSKPDCYLVIAGKLQLKVGRAEDQLLGPNDLFGYTKPLTGKKWTPAKVIAREKAAIVVIPRDLLKKQVEKLKKSEETAALIAFLVKVVPGVRQLGQASKERVLNLFEKVVIKTGDAVIREREKAAHAYIILQGECKLVCSEDPLNRPLADPARGLISTTTSCFNFGLVTHGEWIGEDSVIYDKPMEYSAIATNTVVALRISKEKFLESLNKETQKTLKQRLQIKIRWLKERKANISDTFSKTIYKSDDSIGQNEQVQYATASKAALMNIRRNELARADSNTRNPSPNPRLIRSPSPDPAEAYQIQRSYRHQARPSSSYSHKKQPLRRPQSSHIPRGGRNDSYLSMKQSTASLVPDEHKVKLHTACTIGYSLVPTIPKPKHRVISAFVASVPSPARSNNQQAPYGEKMRQGRPTSPNPAEVWARKYNVDLSRNQPLKAVKLAD